MVPGLFVICLATFFCGAWTIVGSALIAANDFWSNQVMTVALFLFGLGCFSMVYGLLKFRNWARRAVMALSIAMLLLNVAVWYAVEDNPFDLHGLFLLMPCAFAALVVWYMSRSGVAALYSRRF
jgi:peptidoglycan/LPS O-acetylase OafA/YrhL